MKRIMIQADERLLDRARDRALEQGVSVAQVFRDALEQHLGEEAPPRQLSILGIVSSTRGDLSARASDDEYEPEPYR